MSGVWVTLLRMWCPQAVHKHRPYGLTRSRTGSISITGAKLIIIVANYIYLLPRMGIKKEKESYTITTISKKKRNQLYFHYDIIKILKKAIVENKKSRPFHF